MNKYFKPIFSFLLLALAIYCFTKRESGWGILLILASLVFIFLFFRNEFLLLAFFRIRKQDIKGLEKWLRYIKNPKSQLIKPQQAYFYFLNGILLNANGGKVTQVESYMKKALETGLAFKHDRAMAKLNLAASALAKGKKKEAEVLLKETKKLDSAGILNEQIRILKEQIKRAGVPRQTQNPYMRRGKF